MCFDQIGLYQNLFYICKNVLTNTILVKEIFFLHCKQDRAKWSKIEPNVDCYLDFFIVEPNEVRIWILKKNPNTVFGFNILRPNVIFGFIFLSQINQLAHNNQIRLLFGYKKIIQITYLAHNEPNYNWILFLFFFKYCIWIISLWSWCYIWIDSIQIIIFLRYYNTLWKK